MFLQIVIPVIWIHRDSLLQMSRNVSCKYCRANASWMPCASCRMQLALLIDFRDVRTSSQGISECLVRLFLLPTKLYPLANPTRLPNSNLAASHYIWLALTCHWVHPEKVAHWAMCTQWMISSPFPNTCNVHHAPHTHTCFFHYRGQLLKGLFISFYILEHQQLNIRTIWTGDTHVKFHWISV